jgi:hypothetical protein
MQAGLFHRAKDRKAGEKVALVMLMAGYEFSAGDKLLHLLE